MDFAKITYIWCLCHILLKCLFGYDTFDTRYYSRISSSGFLEQGDIISIVYASSKIICGMACTELEQCIMFGMYYENSLKMWKCELSASETWSEDTSLSTRIYKLLGEYKRY